MMYIFVNVHVLYKNNLIILCVVRDLVMCVAW